MTKDNFYLPLVTKVTFGHRYEAVMMLTNRLREREVKQELIQEIFLDIVAEKSSSLQEWLYNNNVHLHLDAITSTLVNSLLDIVQCFGP